MIDDIEIERGFRGSANLKRKGEQIEWTDERLLEYAKCMQDPLYFCKTYMKIVHVDHGLIPFRLYDYQERMISAFVNDRKVCVLTARQSGKALPLDTEIPTPTGYKTIREIQPGDVVFARNGKPTNVTIVSDVFYDHDCYELTFSDGSKITTNASHLWTVYDTINHNKKVTVTTEQISKKFLGNTNKQGYQQSRYRLPKIEPVQYETTATPTIDPYLLGAWLGDGTSAGKGFTCHRDDISHYIDCGIQLQEYNLTTPREFVFEGTITNLAANGKGTSPLRLENLINNKHIPISYLYGSIETRRELLRGLMDTDGWVDKGVFGQIQLTVKNEQLLNDVYQLLRGLGYVVSIKDYPKTNSRRFSFNVGDGVSVFKLQRKLEKVTLSQRPNANSLLIRDVRKVESVPTKCIGVEDPEHLFLATRNHIPTHNTTAMVGFMLWYILFKRNKTVGLLANKGDTAREIFARVLLAYEHLPKWLQQGVIEFNKSSIVLENGSRAIAAASSSSAVRGYSFNVILLDECAFIEQYEQFSQSVLPTISSGKTTQLIMVSTPNGLNHYYNIWTNAVEKRNGFTPIRVTWEEVPGRDEAWRQETLAQLNLDQDKFNQEFGAQFLGSSGTLISGSALKNLVHQVPIHEANFTKQYKLPEEGHKYIIVADVSKGRGLDNSAASVIDVTKMPFEQVATFYDNTTDYPDYAEILHSLANTYNKAVILVENNAGEVVCNALYDDFEYEGVLFTESAGSRGKQISTKAVAKNGVEKGVNTTKTVKQKGCSFLKLLVEQQQLIINDYDTIHELSRFSKKGTSYEAESGAKDDLVMGLVLFSWLSDDKFFKELTDINLLEELRNRRAEEVANSFVPFGLIINGVDDYFTHSTRPGLVKHVENFLQTKLADNDLEEQFKLLMNG